MLFDRLYDFCDFQIKPTEDSIFESLCEEDCDVYTEGKIEGSNVRIVNTK